MPIGTNSESKKGNCNRTTRYGDYKCCPRGTYLCGPLLVRLQIPFLVLQGHIGALSRVLRPTILNKIRDKNCNKTKKYFTALSSFRRMQRWMRVLPSRVACVLNERVGRIDRHFSGSAATAAAAN